MSNLRVLMGGPPDLSVVTASAGHASLMFSSFGITSFISPHAGLASFAAASLAASTDAAAPPVASNIQVSLITSTSARVSWTLDQPATGQVEYGTTTSYGSTTTLAGLGGNHIQDIGTGVNPTPLTPGTLYHFRVIGQNATGQAYASDDQTFTTASSALPSIQTNRPVSSWGGSLAEPAYLASVADPNFEGTITRVTPNGSNWRTQYSRIPPWNADGSLLLLLRDGLRLLDGNTYADLGSLSGIASSRTIWSAVDPRYAWMTKANDNRLYRVEPGAFSRITYRQFTGFSFVNNGMGEGRQSNDDRYHALYVGGATVLVYDAVADTYVTVVLPGTPDWVGMSGSGTYMVARFASDGTGSGQGTWAFTRSGVPVRNLSTSGHGDVVMAANNIDDIYVSVGGGWRATRISDGAQFALATGGAGGHASGCAYQLPGWVLISSHYPGNFSQRGADQIALCAVDGSLDTRVFCHARTVQTPSGVGAYQYALSTHAGVSPDGTKVTWAGAWERATTGNTVGRGYVASVVT